MSHELLRDAITPGTFGEAECYCQNEACVVRTVRLYVKYHPGDPTPRFPWVCPACAHPLKYHGWVGR